MFLKLSSLVLAIGSFSAFSAPFIETFHCREAETAYTFSRSSAGIPLENTTVEALGVSQDGTSLSGWAQLDSLTQEIGPYWVDGALSYTIIWRKASGTPTGYAVIAPESPTTSTVAIQLPGSPSLATAEPLKGFACSH